jgi:hypothetical protein
VFYDNVTIGGENGEKETAGRKKLQTGTDRINKMLPRIMVHWKRALVAKREGRIIGRCENEQTATLDKYGRT